MFVLDDGWFGNGRNARNGDNAGLGDWRTNREKLPHDLQWLAGRRTRRTEVRPVGRTEMVNRAANSLKRIRIGREAPGSRTAPRPQSASARPLETRGRGVRLQVRGRLLTQYPGIEYIKWTTTGTCRTRLAGRLADAQMNMTTR